MSFGPLVFSIFILLNCRPTVFDRHEEFPKVIVQTIWENKISPSLLSDVCGQTVIRYLKIDVYFIYA